MIVVMVFPLLPFDAAETASFVAGEAQDFTSHYSRIYAPGKGDFDAAGSY
jgi:hypothetical protein